MYQTISENIAVLGIFTKSSFTPKKFKWSNKIYPVEKITSIHEIKDGNSRKRCYSVISAGNLFLLHYNLQDESWLLDQIWCEG